MTGQDHRYRDYLLGRLPDAEAELLEAELLENDDLCMTIGSVEDDLFDAFATGRLNDADRAAFASRYRGNAARERIAMSEGLRMRSRNSNVVPMRRGTPFGLAIAAAVALMAVGVAWFASRPAEVPDVAPRTASAPALKPLSVPAPALVPLVVEIGAGTRAEGETRTLDVPKQAGIVELRVPLDPAESYATYTIELRDAQNRVIWKQSGIAPAADEGRRVAVTRVPSEVLSDGTYEVAVSGGGEDLGFETVRIRRTP